MAAAALAQYWQGMPRADAAMATIATERLWNAFSIGYRPCALSHLFVSIVHAIATKELFISFLRGQENFIKYM
jgi:hypothetical protein